MVKCCKDAAFDIDIFGSLDETKRSLVVMAGSKINNDGKTEIRNYEYVIGNEQTEMQANVKRVLELLGAKVEEEIPDISLADILKRIDSKLIKCDKPKSKAPMKPCAPISEELATRLVKGIKGITIHNDCSFGTRIEDECTLYHIFTAINSLPLDEEWIDNAYDRVRRCNLTSNAKSQFDVRRNQFKNKQSSPLALANILKHYNASYWTEKIKPLLVE
jgi:hypothetical protein